MGRIRRHLPRGYRREELRNVWLRTKIDLRYDTVFRFAKAKVANVTAELKKHNLKLHNISGGVKYGSRILSFDTLRGKIGNSDFDLEVMRRKLPPVEHPVVRTHPDTGRRLLYVNPASTAYIQDVPAHESTAMLTLLYEQARSPEIQCRVRWHEGDVVVFDNRCAQHFAVPDYCERRVMHRVTIRGDRTY